MKNICLLSAFTLLSSPVLADITPSDVVLDLQGFSERNQAGFTFERQEGNAGEITLYNVTLGGGVSAILPWVRLAATPEGAVDISTVESVAWEAPIFAVYPNFVTKGTAHLQGLSVHASGAPNDVRYTFAIEAFSYSANNDYRETTEQAAATLRGLSGTLIHRWAAAIGDELEAQLTAAFWEATSSTTIRGENGGEQYDSAADIAIEGAANFAKLNESSFVFTAGSMARRASFGNNFRTETAASAVEFSGRGDPKNPYLKLAMADVSAANLSNNPSMPNLDIRFDTLLFDASATDRFAGAQYPWALEARLEGLVLSPETWALIDPANTLPHAASRLLAKLNGIGERGKDDVRLRPLSLFPEWRTLTLGTLDVNFGGLALVAGGHVSFRASPGVSFGPPMPNGGQIGLQMQGAQRLLRALESGPLGAPFLADLLNASAPTGQSPDDLDVQILFDETGGVSVE